MVPCGAKNVEVWFVCCGARWPLPNPDRATRTGGRLVIPPISRGRSGASTPSPTAARCPVAGRSGQRRIHAAPNITHGGGGPDGIVRSLAPAGAGLRVAVRGPEVADRGRTPNTRRTETWLAAFPCGSPVIVVVRSFASNNSHLCGDYPRRTTKTGASPTVGAGSDPSSTPAPRPKNCGSGAMPAQCRPLWSPTVTRGLAIPPADVLARVG